MVKQSVTKAEKAAGVEMPILGNGKGWGLLSPSAAGKTPGKPVSADDNAYPHKSVSNDDIPF
jgi:hypothetical protein